jgi:uncharacterized LabA/DUF88 family protein
LSKFVYVDNSNVFIEGKRVSAVEKGLALNIWEASNYRILDNDYRLDFGKLHNFVANGGAAAIKRAEQFGSRPPQNDSLWEVAKTAGFETVIEDRNVNNQEKKIDTGIVAAMMRDAYKNVIAAEDQLVLVAGDSDFVPAIQQLREDGFYVKVVFWDHASRELKQACDEFLSLNDHLHELSY